MTRTLKTLTIATALLTTSAHASPGGVYVDQATTSLGLSLENVSGSSDVDDRVFGLISEPMVHVDGQFGCPVGSTADSIQLVFGVMWMEGDHSFGLLLWDESEELDLGGKPYGSFSIDHALNMPQTWDPEGPLVQLGFHPPLELEMLYQASKSKGADMVHWMQSDQAFESVGFTTNALLRCSNGVEGLDSVDVDVTLLYHGDRRISYQPLTDTPDDLTTGGGDPTRDVTSGGGDPTGSSGPTGALPSGSGVDATGGTSVRG